MGVREVEGVSQIGREGGISMDQGRAESAVRGPGLGTIPLPGDITTQKLERIIGDVASLSVKWTKPLSARLLPVAGAKAGDRTAFDDTKLINTIIQPLPKRTGHPMFIIKKT